jgi:uncharacterized membrane protein
MLANIFFFIIDVLDKQARVFVLGKQFKVSLTFVGKALLANIMPG